MFQYVTCCCRRGGVDVGGVQINIHPGQPCHDPLRAAGAVCQTRVGLTITSQAMNQFNGTRQRVFFVINSPVKVEKNRVKC